MQGKERFNPLIDNLLSGVDRYELTYDDAFSAYAPVKINILFPSLTPIPLQRAQPSTRTYSREERQPVLGTVTFS
jgi:hypothetical protein